MASLRDSNHTAMAVKERSIEGGDSTAGSLERPLHGITVQRGWEVYSNT